MWNLVPLRVQLPIIGVIYFVVAWIVQKFAPSFGIAAGNDFRTLSIASMIVGTVLLNLVPGLWRPIWRCCPWLERITFPDLTGTWAGHLESDVLDPETKQRKPPREANVKIRQGLFKIDIEMVTGQSTSESTRSILETKPLKREFYVWYTYLFEPQGMARMGKHEGVSRLVFNPDNGTDCIKGYYYTARNTGGQINLRRVSRSVKMPAPTPTPIADETT